MICTISPTPVSPTPEKFTIPISPIHSIWMNNKKADLNHEKYLNMQIHCKVYQRKMNYALILFLSHLLIAGCDIGVQISVHLFVRPSVNIYVEVFAFSALVIAVTVKPCIVIVLDIPFKHAP